MIELLCTITVSTSLVSYIPYVGPEISRLLLDDGQRLVTIVGPGGMGKTRLGLAAARALLDQFLQVVAILPQLLL